MNCSTGIICKDRSAECGFTLCNAESDGARKDSMTDRAAELVHYTYLGFETDVD